MRMRDSIRRSVDFSGRLEITKTWKARRVSWQIHWGIMWRKVVAQLELVETGKTVKSLLATLFHESRSECQYAANERQNKHVYSVKNPNNQANPGDTKHEIL